MPRSLATVLVALMLLGSGAWPAPQAQSPAAGLRVLGRDGTRTLPITPLNNQDYVALDDVATAFNLTLREDRLAGGVTVTGGNNRPVIITPDQPVVSVAGRLVSLGAPPVRQGNRWLVPLDFLQRALGSALETRIELRRSSRLLLVGDIRAPRVVTRVESTPGSATVVFDITPATPTRVTLDAGRLLVTFEADALDFSQPSVAAQDFIQSLQPGDTPTTLAIVPGPRFGLHRATTSQPDGNSSRLTIELLPAGTPAPAAPAPAPPSTPAPAADPLPPPAPTGVRTIVIDPGHGGDEAGARGADGTEEKDITLAVARRLRTLIESRLGLRVFLTRDDDRALPLDNRAAYANSQRADVFLSIHVNAALRPGMKGAEVYYLGGDPSIDEAAGSGAENAVLPALGGGTRSIDLVPWESAQARSRERSSELANLVEQALRARVEMSPRAVQQAPFRVLVGATMPAALVEIGYLSNPEQEQALRSGAYQDQIAQALFDAIVQFRSQVERQGPRSQ